jgi:hypothetical protein
MKAFAGKELIRFLTAIDEHLESPFRLELIGAAAAILAFKINRGTFDIDSTNDVRKIEKACQAARVTTGLDIPVQTVGIYDGPYEYESRLTRMSAPRLKKLQIFVPEKHDWALMKVMRFNQKDIDDIQAVGDRVGFKKDTFIGRFLGEMTHVHGNKTDLIANFLTMMERLFGEVEADSAQEAIRRHKHWK